MNLAGRVRVGRGQTGNKVCDCETLRNRKSFRGQRMHCSQPELDLKESVEARHRISQHPTLLAIERSVCGCDFGADSWTTRKDADRLAEKLKLGPDTRLLDLGAGTGWPSLYFAEQTGCEVVLVDLPETGLRIARERAKRDNIANLITTVIADASNLPFAVGRFDAISHSDLLCCLPRKEETLSQCHRVIRSDGIMAFTVIAIAPGLSPKDKARAIENGPPFIESDADYRTLLGRTGWAIIESADSTDEYAKTLDRQIAADQAQESGLVALLGREDYDLRLASWYDKVSALQDGLLRRETFVAIPDNSRH